MKLAALETPALVLDATRMTENIARMRGRLDGFGVAFRPHLKTCKSIDVARHLLSTPTGPATVSTLKEAEYFFGHGVTDLLYAVGIAPNKLAHVVELRRRGAALRVILDSEAAARAVGTAARDAGLVIEALIEIDSDGHRSGIKPDDAALLDVARALEGAGGTLAGVMTHAGDSYNRPGREAITAMAEQERAAAVHADRKSVV